MLTASVACFPRTHACAGGDIIETAKALLSVPHSGERLEKVWHVTGVFTVPDLKRAIKLALEVSVRCCVFLRM